MIRLATEGRNGATKGLADKVDAGTGAGTLEIRTGAQPASANNSDTGTLLVTFTLSDPAFGSPSTGVVALAGVPKTAAAGANGTAQHFRVKDSAGTRVFDGSVSATGGGGDLVLNSTTITNGQNVTITAANLTVPEA